MDEQLDTIEQLKVTIIDLAVRFGPKLLAAILVLIAGVLISRWLGRWFDRGVSRIVLEPPVRLLLSRIARVLLLTLFVIVALQNLGVELLPLMGETVTPGGFAVLAGILDSEHDVVVDALRDNDWQLRRTHVEEGWWSALVQHH